MKGKRIFLDSIHSNDKSILFKWINNRDLVLFNGFFQPINESQHAHWFESIQQRKDTLFFAIRLLDSTSLIGTCQLLNIHPVHRSAELQIRIGEITEQDKGYGTEAVNLLLQFAFQDLNLNRLQLHVFSTNMRAKSLYQKAGFISEGLLRNAAYIDGQYLDIEIMGLLKEDYLKSKSHITTSRKIAQPTLL